MIAENILEPLRHAIELRLAEVDALPQGVQIWMMSMRMLFLSSIVFAVWKKEARIVLAMAITTAILLFGIKAIFPEIHSAQIGRPIHLTLWTATLIYLVTRRRVFLTEIKSGRPFSVTYGIWAWVVVAVLTASLVMDFSALIRGSLTSP